MASVTPQTFDRSSFGVGSLTTNRYQPPEHVGDPLPPREAVMGGGGGGSLNPSGSRDRLAGGAAGSGAPLNLPTGPAAYRSTGSTGAAPGAGRALTPQQGSFMPFAMPTYAIPAIDGRAKVR